MTLSRLEDLRDEISHVDQDLVRLLNRRAAIAKEIGGIKAELGREVYDPSQESRIYSRLAEISEGELPLKALKAIYREIMSASRLLQKPVKVAYFGLETSFTHLAALSHFGSSSLFYSQPSLAGVFLEVEKGKVEWGVVPVENSLEGSINMTLDKLITTPLHIRAEIFLRITHCLLTLHENEEDIKKIYSHPQPLAQCQGWLRNRFPRATLIEVESTPAAAKRVAEEKEGAAICSKDAAAIYGLNIFAEGIEDLSSNTTRFLVIGGKGGFPTGRDKTSLLFATSDTPGALHSALQSFADRGINMVKIESYPVKDRLWEYLFFVDVAGHVEDEDMRLCLNNLREKTTFLKILGSYPRGEDRS